MRVLLVNDWTAHVGGAEQTVAWLREGLHGGGDEVRLLMSSVGDVGAVQPDYVAYGTDRRAAQVALQVVNPSAVRQVALARREFRPDVALAFMFEMHLSPAALLAMRDVPTVIFALYPKPVCMTAYKRLPDGTPCTTTAGPVCWRSGCVSLPHLLRDMPRYALIRSALRRAAKVLTCSDAISADVRSLGVDADTLDLAVPGPSPAFRREPAPHPQFVYVGRLMPEKGVDLLLRAFGRLLEHEPCARLRVVGGGPERQRLAELAAPLGAAVEFTGRVPPEDVEHALGDAWALVAPTVTPEPFGLVALEAAVRGVPVIASATGGFAQTVEPGVNGLLFPNGDEDALLERLRAVASGAAFPAHEPGADVVARVSERHDLGRHVAAVRERLVEAAA